MSRRARGPQSPFFWFPPPTLSLALAVYLSSGRHGLRALAAWHIRHRCAAGMDPHVLAFVGPAGARLTHLPFAIGALDRSMVAAGVDWLLLDVHLAPQVALRAVRRVAAMCRRTLWGAVLTIKLNDRAFVDQLPLFLEEVRALGLPEPKARQLPAHRQELAIVGPSALGKKRRV